ncbi:MAG: LysR family transcriptional regulator [Bacteroidales bacterium]|nr:LysR family transcriptional regulator [Bacteroidales bacterium]
MNISRIDLNLLVYLDVLLREGNVTRAAEQLGLSQPAMSNGLRRLRDLFNDPLLVRTSDGMTPTDRARELQPLVREALLSIERAVEPKSGFDAANEQRVFRLMVSDYTECTLIPVLLDRLQAEAPGIVLDVLAPGDMSYDDVEKGRVDMAINRFDTLPQAFHQMVLWKDQYVCMLNVKNPVLENFTLENYLAAPHVWVSKTGMGASRGINLDNSRRLGWVDTALRQIGKQRQIRVYTRHYLAAMVLAQQKNVVVTLPSKAARIFKDTRDVAILKPPFRVPPIELTMAWSPLLQHNPAHQWMRRLVSSAAKEIVEIDRRDPFWK